MMERTSTSCSNHSITRVVFTCDEYTRQGRFSYVTKQWKPTDGAGLPSGLDLYWAIGREEQETFSRVASKQASYGMSASRATTDRSCVAWYVVLTTKLCRVWTVVAAAGQV